MKILCMVLSGWLCSSALGAVEIKLSAELPAGRQPTTGTLEMTMASDSGEFQTQRMEIPIPSPPSMKFTTSPGRSMEIRVSAAGYWAPSQIVIAHDNPRPVRFKLLPVTRVRGFFKLPPGESRPVERFDVRFESAGASTSGKQAGAIPQSTVECDLDDKSGFWCELPVGTLDLRLRARGYISHYQWGQVLQESDDFFVGTLQLERGSSVAGLVESSQALELEKTSVRLVPVQAGGARSSGRVAKTTITTEVSPKGFFHFQGLPPGQYRLEAEHPKGAFGEVFPVTVMKDAETSVNDPISLDPPATLEVSVNPPVDPYGQRWRLELVEERRGNTMTPVASAATDEAGEWSKKGLRAGSYRLFVTDGAGSRWGNEEVRLAGASRAVEIRPEMVPIEGQVFLGEDPVAATLWFGGRHGLQSIQAEAADDGKFAGYLPREGKWSVSVMPAGSQTDRAVRPVEVEQTEAGDTAWIEIHLSDLRIAGEVLDAKGAAAPGAIVFLSGTAGAPIQAQADRDGSFEFFGVEEDDYQLQAHRATGRSLTESSESVLVPLRQDEAPPFHTLRLVARRELRGHVMSSQGPVPGSLVTVQPLAGGQPTTWILPKEQTSIDGSFVIDIPENTDTVEVTVMPPGFGLKVMRLPVSGVDEINIPVYDAPGMLSISGAGTDLRESYRALRITQNGIPLGIPALENWTSTYSAELPATDDIVLPRLEFGQYEACFQSTQDDKSGSGAVVCADGVLLPNGTLALDLRNSAQEN